MELSYKSPLLSTAFEALANDKRRGMIQALSFRPATISQLADEFDLTLPAMHKHIRILEKAKLIKRRKAGRTNFVALNRASLSNAQEWLNQFHTEWGDDRESLDNYIASLKDRS